MLFPGATRSVSPGSVVSGVRVALIGRSLASIKEARWSALIVVILTFRMVRIPLSVAKRTR